MKKTGLSLKDSAERKWAAISSRRDGEKGKDALIKILIRVVIFEDSLDIIVRDDGEGIPGDILRGRSDLAEKI
jgi:hypothetical protein